MISGITRTTATANFLQTIDWFQGMIVDWNSAGTAYALDGSIRKLHHYHFGFQCDGSITSACGNYVFLYQRLGTKGLLLKNGEILREINRSYYHSDVYEFPAAFFVFEARTYLAHCPISYKRLDFEDVESGEIATNYCAREPQDFFHSRLEVSPDDTFLMSRGWFWHPFDAISVFDIAKCFKDLSLLDNGGISPNVASEICSASFIDSDRILVCASDEDPFDDDMPQTIPPGHFAVWNFRTNVIANVLKPEERIGNLFAIDDRYFWDTFNHPKIIALNNGEIVGKIEDVNSGEQNSSIIHHLNPLPQIAFNKETGQIAISANQEIEILGPTFKSDGF
ncbi:hypothetical protein [Flavobacterium sp.]|uniref:hypothetical protein n=1 Tax=Flavobacterium sp. TaxID=239 RepID=UPI001200428A|nr:hypothetical protein [Flavobacterium sp.]RZJ70821.1 MAG: hypothetical protein EOO49_11805 [Flavobacterium sp.]